MSLGTVLAALVIVIALPLNWLVTARLWRLSRMAPEVVVLRDRAIVALALALIVTVFALIFVNNELVPPPLNGEVTKVITRLAVLVLSVVPSLYWLRRIRDDQHDR